MVKSVFRGSRFTVVKFGKIDYGSFDDLEAHSISLVYSTGQTDGLRVLCPDQPGERQEVDYGGHPILDGARSYQQAALWPQSRRLVSRHHGHRDAGGRTTLLERNSYQS